MTENWQEPVVYPPVSAQPAPPPVPAAPTSGYGFTVPVGPAPAPIVAQPLSDKSKTVAGLLQLLPGLVLGLNGLGRLYAGQVGLGVVQLVATAIGWISFWCGFLLLFPFAVFVGVWLWAVIDGIVLLAGRPVDGQGRLLRG
jgi:TM2 domain-containing membrane protein YozV